LVNSLIKELIIYKQTQNSLRLNAKTINFNNFQLFTKILHNHSLLYSLKNPTPKYHHKLYSYISAINQTKVLTYF